MAREFPRLWDTNFKLSGTAKIDDGLAGRMDLVANAIMGDPGMYMLLAAANNIRNVLTLRPTIRPADEAIRTELEMRGVPDSQLDKAVSAVMGDLAVGKGDWLSYESVGTSGTITDVETNTVLGIPDMESAADFVTKYSGDGV